MFFGATTEYYRSGQPSRSFDRSATRPAPPKGHSTATRDENLPLANPLSASSGQPGVRHEEWRTISRIDRHASSNRSPHKAPTSTYLSRTDSSDVDAKDANDGLRDTVTYQDQHSGHPSCCRLDTPEAAEADSGGRVCITHSKLPKQLSTAIAHPSGVNLSAASHQPASRSSNGRHLARAGANSGSKRSWLHSACRRQAVHTKGASHSSRDEPTRCRSITVNSPHGAP
jgi:hypothetical protein